MSMLIWWKRVRRDKDANQTIQLKRRDTLAFNNSKEIKQRWCKGKQFQSNNISLKFDQEVLIFFDYGYELKLESSFTEG